jgi:hypothetical protein
MRQPAIAVSGRCKRGALMVLLGLAPQVLAAQIHRGDTLRVYFGNGVSSQGALTRADSATMVIQETRQSAEFSIRRADIRSLERLDGTRTVGRGAVVGGVVVGAIAGVQAGIWLRARDQRNGGLLINDFPYRGIAGTVGALTGALIGVLVSRIRFTHWEGLPANASLLP